MTCVPPSGSGRAQGMSGHGWRASIVIGQGAGHDRCGVPDRPGGLKVPCQSGRVG